MKSVADVRRRFRRSKFKINAFYTMIYSFGVHQTAEAIKILQRNGYTNSRTSYKTKSSFIDYLR